MLHKKCGWGKIRNNAADRLRVRTVIVDAAKFAQVGEYSKIGYYPLIFEFLECCSGASLNL